MEIIPTGFINKPPHKLVIIKVIGLSKRRGHLGRRQSPRSSHELAAIALAGRVVVGCLAVEEERWIVVLLVDPGLVGGATIIPLEIQSRHSIVLMHTSLVAASIPLNLRRILYRNQIIRIEIPRILRVRRDRRWQEVLLSLDRPPRPQDLVLDALEYRSLIRSVALDHFLCAVGTYCDHFLRSCKGDQLRFR